MKSRMNFSRCRLRVWANQHIHQVRFLITKSTDALETLCQDSNRESPLFAYLLPQQLILRWVVAHVLSHCMLFMSSFHQLDSKPLSLSPCHKS